MQQLACTFAHPQLSAVLRELDLDVSELRTTTEDYDSYKLPEASYRDPQTSDLYQVRAPILPRQLRACTEFDEQGTFSFYLYDLTYIHRSHSLFATGIVPCNNDHRTSLLVSFWLNNVVDQCLVRCKEQESLASFRRDLLRHLQQSRKGRHCRQNLLQRCALRCEGVERVSYAGAHYRRPHRLWQISVDPSFHRPVLDALSAMGREAIHENWGMSQQIQFRTDIRAGQWYRIRYDAVRWLPLRSEDDYDEFVYAHNVMHTTSQIEGEIAYQDLVHDPESTQIARFLTAYFDIETESHRSFSSLQEYIVHKREHTFPSDTFPDPLHAADAVTDIACVVHWQTNSVDRCVHVLFTLGPPVSVPSAVVYSFRTDAMLIEAFRFWVVHRLRPDLIGGYNSEQFDKLYLLLRRQRVDAPLTFTRFHGCECWLQTNENAPMDTSEDEPGDGGFLSLLQSGANTDDAFRTTLSTLAMYRPSEWSGMMNVDVFLWIRKFSGLRLQRYTLKAVSAQLLNRRQKLDFSYHLLKPSLRMSDEDKRAFPVPRLYEFLNVARMLYCLVDADVCAQISQRQKLCPSMCADMAITYSNLFQQCVYGQTKAISAQIRAKLHQDGWYFPAARFHAFYDEMYERLQRSARDGRQQFTLQAASKKRSYSGGYVLTTKAYYLMNGRRFPNMFPSDHIPSAQEIGDAYPPISLREYEDLRCMLAATLCIGPVRITEDFASLYPSIIRAYNLCPTVAIDFEKHTREGTALPRDRIYVSVGGMQFVLRQRRRPRDQQSAFGGDIDVWRARIQTLWAKLRRGWSPRGVPFEWDALEDLRVRPLGTPGLGHFLRACDEAELTQSVPTIMPVLLTTLLQQRKAAKKSMASMQALATQEQNGRRRNYYEYEASRYNGMQLSYKLIMNSIYGAMGYASFIYRFPVAMLTTALGREMLKRTIRICESMGRPVAYGDTDSIMVLFKEVYTHSEEHVIAMRRAAIWQEAKKIAEAVTQDLVSPNELEVESEQSNMLQKGKKMYACQQRKEGQPPEPCTKGISFVTRGFPQMTRTMATRMLAALQANDVLRALYEFLVQARSLVLRQLPLEMYKQTISVKRSYAHGKFVVLQALARERRETNPEFTIPTNERFEYATVYDPSTNHRSARAIYFPRLRDNNPLENDRREPQDDQSWDLDHDYYWQDCILSPAHDLLSPVLSTIAGYTKPLSRISLQQSHLPQFSNAWQKLLEMPQWSNENEAKLRVYLLAWDDEIVRTQPPQPASRGARSRKKAKGASLTGFDALLASR